MLNLYAPGRPSWCRILAVAVFATLAALAGCKGDEQVYDTLYLQIASETPIEQLRIRFRAGKGGDRRVIGADGEGGTRVDLPGSVDLMGLPYIVRVEPGELAGIVDMVVTGYHGEELAAVWAGPVDLGVRRPVAVVLTKVATSCDGDEDGAMNCDIAACCPGALVDYPDCDDAVAEASPFAAALPACIPCGTEVDWFCDGQKHGCADADGDESADCEDCAPDDETVGPGNPEICGNGKDDNCDGAEDEGWLWYDGDVARKVGESCGIGACAGGVVSCDNTYAVPVCTTFEQRSTERCADDADNDCDGSIDEGCDPGDVDGDGYLEDDCRPYDALFNPGAAEPCCPPGAPLSSCDRDCDGESVQCASGDGDHDGYATPDDCDDTDATVYPGAPERCGDGIDQNCSGADTGCTDPGVSDKDGDGWVAPGDCDDFDAKVFPGAQEICNGRDDDCDGVVDGGNPGGGAACTPDALPSVCKEGTLVCVHIGAAGEVAGVEVACVGFEVPPVEECNGLDDDCDGDVDEGFLWEGTPVGEACEGVGECGAGTVECIQVEGGASAALCSAMPGGSESGAAPELCDALDNDCDGAIDEELSAGLMTGCLAEGVCAAGVPAACVDGEWDCGYAQVPGWEESELTCDSKDNDCDGAVDEELTWEGALVGEACDGTGACGEGVVECAASGLTTCSTNPGATAYDGTAETCNGIDDDCDGVIDEDLASDVPTDCLADGVCGTGVPAVCIEGAWDCDYEQVAGWEASELTCDSKDNDCDGAVDEELSWEGALVGDACDGTGACGGGVVECAATGAATCSTNPNGSAYGGDAESCNGLDDDCDGETDEGFQWEGQGVGGPCEGVGECGAGAVECLPSGDGAACSTDPGGTDYPANSELCDGKDNDCDGATDEVFPYGGAEGPLPGEACDGAGACGAGTVECQEDGAASRCSTDPGGSEDASVAELCNGVDDDCDGAIDEDFGWGGAAVGAACDGTGACGEGLVECLGDGSGATCSTNSDGSASGATPEDCNDQDDDCNGVVDDGLPVGAAAIAAAACNTKGVCSSPLIEPLCTDGGWVCQYTVAPGYEPVEATCDGEDNDCDGAIDEGFAWGGAAIGASCDGEGACGQGIVECTANGNFAICSTNPGASADQSAAEDCNGADDDCNGTADDNLPTGLAAVAAAKCKVTGVCLPALVKASCTTGKWGCSYVDVTDYESPEATCDGLDNDCDGTTDEGFLYGGQAVGGACDGVGACGAGVVECDDNGKGAVCSTDPGGSAPGDVSEDCNGKDDDCDGQVDNHLPTGAAAIAAAKCNTQGVCNSPLIAPTCSTGAWTCHPEAIAGHEAGAELSCDGLDNDCDGLVDDDFSYDGKAIDAACDGVGACGVGVVECTGDGLAATCSTNPNGSKAGDAQEICNGADDDCDGSADEDFGDLGDPCDGDDDDLCIEGQMQCSVDGAMTVCSDPNDADPELCNGEDEDCDGEIDEGFALGVACDGADLDQCKTGVTVCTVDELGTVCDEPAGSGIVEVCDGEDNDCDLLVDEDFNLGDPCVVPDGEDADSCDEAGVLVCGQDQAALCDLIEESNQVEVCNGVDDDCDGTIDDGFPVGDKCDGNEDTCFVGVLECNPVPDGDMVCKGDLPGAPTTTCETGDPDTFRCNVTGDVCTVNLGDLCNGNNCRCGAGGACNGVTEVCIEGTCQPPGGGP